MTIDLETRQLPVLLLTGYLGSGKTTLLNRILSNRRGIKFAVIVNDIGEVNIDADLIEKGGVVGQGDDSLVALQNGCICCTLKMDLITQIAELASAKTFDYIVIEASGVCEPAPIANTISTMPQFGIQYTRGAIPYVDCIVTVVDALRMKDEFAGGASLQKEDIGDEDLERLIIEQVEFCNIVLLNKASEVTPDELGRLRAIVKGLNPGAKVLECDYGDIDLDEIIYTGMFDFETVATSAAWISAIEGENQEHEDVLDEDEDALEHDHENEHSQERKHENEHGHGHNQEHEHEHEHEREHSREDDHRHSQEHEHEHDHKHSQEHEREHEQDHDHEHKHGHGHKHGHSHEGEALEYGIDTFVYTRREPLDLNKFDYMIAKHWPPEIIRAKGICYFSNEPDQCCLFEQAGRQKSVRDAGLWYAAMDEEELREQLERDALLRRDWDPVYGDRMQKIVFIGRNLERKKICSLMDSCLADGVSKG